MALFRKKPDPISARARELNAQIAALEGQIRNLTSDLKQEQSDAPAASAAPAAAAPRNPRPAPAPPKSREPVFESVDDHRIKSPEDPEPNRARYNDLGVRKYDGLDFWRRLKALFRPPTPANPKLVNFLAAGSIQGLRPLRYEKRVARNRFIILVVLLLIVVGGILATLFRYH